MEKIFYKYLLVGIIIIMNFMIIHAQFIYYLFLVFHLMIQMFVVDMVIK
jgi:hypothetical protein